MTISSMIFSVAQSETTAAVCLLPRWAGRRRWCVLCKFGTRALYRDRQSDEYVFMSECGPFTRDGFAKRLKAAAERAGLDNVHPHALRRHACGHALAMKGRDTRLIQDWLGHRNIQHTSH
jgi:site-specific recombinase XerD